MKPELEAKMEELAEEKCHFYIADVKGIQAFNVGFRAAVELIEKDVKGLFDDEYVRQIGTWKVIQRLEEQVKNHESFKEDILKALKSIKEDLEQYDKELDRDFLSSVCEYHIKKLEEE